MARKKQKTRTVKQHENIYIHIPKKVLWIFAPLWIPFILAWYVFVACAGMLTTITMLLFVFMMGWLANPSYWIKLVTGKLTKDMLPKWMTEGL